MYSFKDRMRAVELYIKLGKRIKATIRQLEFPTKNSLKDWCRKYERGLGLRKSYPPRKPKHSEQEKDSCRELAKKAA